MSKYKSRLEILEKIEERKQRIKALKKHGDKACSSYDLAMGYDANFYLNVCPLPENHLRYYLKELNEWDKKHKTPNVQLTLF